MCDLISDMISPPYLLGLHPQVQPSINWTYTERVQIFVTDLNNAVGQLFA
jgi:hypothetical protein